MNKTYTAEILGVGTELLLGNIVNTDARDISVMLSEIGINVYWHSVVGDNPERLTESVDIAKKRADIIITTGGLGPTLDDLTKETLATVFGKKMALHQPSLDRIKGFFQTIGREMTPNNEKQAWLPEGCTVFVPLGELVDLAKEKERLTAELERVEGEIRRADGKLQNRGFIEKAPKNLVEAERAKRDKFIEMKQKIEAQIKEL